MNRSRFASERVKGDSAAGYIVRTVLKNCADIWASNREEGAFVESAWVLINDAREWLGRSGDRGGTGDAALARTVLCGSDVSKDLRPT